MEFVYMLFALALFTAAGFEVSSPVQALWSGALQVSGCCWVVLAGRAAQKRWERRQC